MENDPIGTAVISWVDGSGYHLRVYSTDGYTVTERCADPGSNGWYDGAFSQPGSAVSATCWQDGSGAHYRLYCTSNDTTTEWCNDPGTGWTQGAYTVS